MAMYYPVAVWFADVPLGHYEKIIDLKWGGDDSPTELDWVRKYFKDPLAVPHNTKGRHTYLFPISKAMKKMVQGLRKPYPKDNKC